MTLFLYAPSKILTSETTKIPLNTNMTSPIAQLVRASSRYAKAAGSIPSQGTYKNQPMNAEISRTTNQCFYLYPFISLKSIKNMTRLN